VRIFLQSRTRFSCYRGFITLRRTCSSDIVLGGTWHGADVAVVLWFFERPWVLLVVVLTLAAASIKLVQKRQRRIAWVRKDDALNTVQNILSRISKRSDLHSRRMV
jgi:hypothetical protein